MKSEERLILIDAYSQIFRCFFAIRSLTNSRGEPVNAAFGFMKLMLKLEKFYPSTAGAMLFDCSRKSFRNELLPEYKANRPPMPDNLRSQIPLIKSIAEAFGWKLFQHDGWEADDLIGGLSKKFTGCPVQIVSSDKDLSQLIDQRISMLVPSSDSSTGFEHRGEAEVVKKFGITPELIIDYLALIGDSSDNVPGVPGIGPKSAVDLLNTFGAAGTWVDSVEKLSDSKYYKKLCGETETLKRNRKLIALNTVLPDELQNISLPEKAAPNWREITRICRDNQFRSLLKELPEVPEAEEDFEEDTLFAFAENNAEETARQQDAEKSCEQLELF